MTEESLITQLKIRLPDELKLRLEQAAAEAGRSVNAEIIFRLECTLPKTPVDMRSIELRRALERTEMEIRYTTAELQRRRTSLKRAKLAPDHPDHHFFSIDIARWEERLGRQLEKREGLLTDIASDSLEPFGIERTDEAE